MKIGVKLNLWIARIIAISMSIGAIYLFWYIKENTYPGYVGGTTLWLLWALGVGLTAIVVMLNIIASLLVKTPKFVMLNTVKKENPHN